MDRRKLLKITSASLGFALSGGALTAFMSTCNSDTIKKNNNNILTIDQLDLVRSLSEIILPATDSPGAEDAKVTAYIDLAVAEYFSVSEQNDFFKILEYFNGQSLKLFDLTFQKISVEKQNKVMHIAAKEAAENKKHPFSQFRALVISAYFTSELVSTKVLNYDPVPGPYQGCLPIEDVGNMNSAI